MWSSEKAQQTYRSRAQSRAKLNFMAANVYMRDPLTTPYTHTQPLNDLKNVCKVFSKASRKRLQALLSADISEEWLFINPLQT